MHQRKYDTRFLVIICILHLIWYAAGLLWQHFYNGDSYEYIYLADSIRQGHYYSGNPALPINEYKQSLRTPVYSLFLLLFYNVLGYKSWLIFLLQNAISVSSCYITFRMFSRLHSSRRYYWLYLVFIAFYPAQMVFSNMIVPDILLQFFLVLYLKALEQSFRRFRPGLLLEMSLWLLLATLTKPIVYPLLLLHLLFALGWAIRQWKAIAIAWGLLPLLAMAGYGFWNQQRTGFFHISSVQSVNLLEHNMNRFLEHHYGKAYADSVIGLERKKIAAMPHLKEKYSYAATQTSVLLKKDLLPYALFHARESLRFFVEPGKSELDLFSGSLTYHQLVRKENFYSSYQKDGIAGALRYLSQFPLFPLVLLTILFNILRLVGWVLFLRNRKVPVYLKVAFSLYLLYFAVITGPVANTRYFLPVLPLLSGMAAIGWAAGPLTARAKRKALHDS